MTPKAEIFSALVEQFMLHSVQKASIIRRSEASGNQQTIIAQLCAEAAHKLLAIKKSLLDDTAANDRCSEFKKRENHVHLNFCMFIEDLL